jgi:hypothetical protein
MSEMKANLTDDYASRRALIRQKQREEMLQALPEFIEESDEDEN